MAAQLLQDQLSSKLPVLPAIRAASGEGTFNFRWPNSLVYYIHMAYMGQKERQKEPGSEVPGAYLGGRALAGDRAASLSFDASIDLCLSTL